MRSGQKTGKSVTDAIVALWWPLTHERGTVMLTAPSFSQITDILWYEVHRLYRGARWPLGGELAKDPSTGWRLPGDRRIICRSTDKPERMAGFSGRNFLIVVDEASGFPEPLWPAVLGNLAGGGKLLATSNPTQVSGTFYEAFGKNAEFWNTIQVRSDQTPNVLSGAIDIEGMATREWVEQRKREWGEESAEYQVRVLGNFPSQADNAVVPIGAVHAAQARFEATPAKGRLHLGVDVARFGDDETVIQPRRGLKTFEPRILHGFDNVDVAGEVLKLARELRESDREIPFVKVDCIGNGSGVVDVLSRSREVETAGVNVAENATADGYHKLRDQLWFAIRDWLTQGGALHHDGRLMSELVAPTYKFDAQGRQQVQSKDDIKKILKRSPDRADALALSLYEAPLVDDEVFGISAGRW